MDTQKPDRLRELQQLFARPPAPVRPVLFWLWNGELQPERIRAQLEDIAGRGFGGVVIHPMAENFRLDHFIHGMSPPYLSDEFFDMVKLAVRHAAQLGLQVWLYDEGGWPSGSAQGKVVEGHPELAARTLVCRRIDPAQSSKASADAVPRCAVMRDGLIRAMAPSATPPTDTRALLSFEEVAADDGYPDLLNPAATKRFIQLTHARYAAAVGEWFGTVIPGIFTDEPAVRGSIGGEAIPWSPVLADRLARLWGEAWPDRLPMLFGSAALGFDPFEVFGEQAVVGARVAYCKAVAEQYRDSYWVPLDEWCAAHGLVHTGHVGGEDSLPDHLRGGFFDWFATAGTLHAPGIDVIWRQLAPDRLNAFLPLLPASALHQRPAGAAPPRDLLTSGLAVSESYAVYGYGATFAQYAWVANYQFVRGINRIWPMAYYYSTSDGRAYGTMSHLGPGNPLWPLWRAFNLYLARLSAVVSATGHACDIAVYYPIEAQWAYGDREEAQRAWTSLLECCQLLARSQIPSDVLPADVLANAQVRDGYLETPGQAYSTVIIPDCSILPAEVASTLAALHEAGGRVCFLGEPPKLEVDGGGACRASSAIGQLADVAVVLDERRDREEWATASAAMGPGGTGSIFDGMTAAFFGPAGTEALNFSPSALQRDAVITAPGDEWPRLARLLAFTGGRYLLEPIEPQPELEMAARWLSDDVWLHIAFNASDHSISTRLALISDRPSAVEQWDPLSGRRCVLACHLSTTEPTFFTIDLQPGQTTVLLTRPLRPEDTPSATRTRPLVLASVEEAEEVMAVERCVIEHGSLKAIPDNLPASSTRFARWRDVGLGALSGRVRYSFAIVVAEEYLDWDLILYLGDVEYSAAVFVNGQRAGAALWPPYQVHVGDLLVPGHNEVVVEVSNTLAAQVLDPANIAEAEQNGWDNPYYRRTLPWHEETPGGGLLGPVLLLAYPTDEEE